MPEVHLPDLDGHEEEPDTPSAAPQAPQAAALPRRGKSLVTIGLEVVLITAGVFLGLMGEQWRERAAERELAEASLRRFRTEIQANRKAVADRVDYHTKLRKDLEAFFALSEPRPQSAFKVAMTQGLAPVFFEEAAWDLALATQSLAHIDADLAFEVSRIYTTQRGYAAVQSAIVQSTVYGRSPNQDFEGFWRSVMWYLGDVSFFDPTLIKAYDDILPRIARALGESTASTTE